MSVKPKRQNEPAMDPVEADAEGGRLYAVPALEKSLDVLEFLARQETPVTLTGIAQQLERSPGELFRILSVLHRRGWIARSAGDSYRLSTRLFELASAYPPAKRLADVALPEMRLLAGELRQSCHLSTDEEGEQLVLLSVEAPGPAGVFVRAGIRYPLATTASGRVMLAFGQPERATTAPVRTLSPEGAERIAPADLPSRLERIRERGYEEVAGEWLDAVVDICWPVFNARGEVAAVIAMPFLGVAPLHQDVQQARARVRAAAEEITKSIGGGDYQERLDLAAGRSE